jgi:hypothetical protein
MSEPERTDQSDRPAGENVLINVHPGLPPAIAMGLFVSPEEQVFIDAMRRRSWLLAIERGHIRQ